MSDSYWNYEDYDFIMCPYCGEEYEPEYDLVIGDDRVYCYSEDEKQTVRCTTCNKRFTILPYRTGFHYKTETIDGEITEEEHELWSNPYKYYDGECTDEKDNN